MAVVLGLLGMEKTQKKRWQSSKICSFLTYISALPIYLDLKKNSQATIFKTSMHSGALLILSTLSDYTPA
jgi:hypothetical protein